MISLPAVAAHAGTVSYHCLFCCALRLKSHSLLGFMHAHTSARTCSCSEAGVAHLLVMCELHDHLVDHC